MEVRLIVDRPASGSWNMAVDHAMLVTAAETRSATLRFYEWIEPTVTLGYFQNYLSGDAHATSRSCPRLRRATGGGAIVHDCELTYALTVPTSQARDSDISSHWYRVMHQGLIKALAEIGLLADEVRESDPGRPTSYLCFQRRSIGDVVFQGHKICGSAQRRRHGALLQHGSLLLRRSRHAPELAGLGDLAHRPVAAGDVQQLWCRELVQQSGFDLIPGEWSESEMLEAQTVAAGQFASSAWNQKR
ncbi:MAG: lipoate--protein ligase family protein [Planctomycetes bacterium]|nr:lipoate--protein ligase family protein [Planctomycetota bacterium]